MWEQIFFDPIQPNGTCKELWVHGPVYQLVKKGYVLDTPVHCYASHYRSQSKVFMQFGEHGTVCTVDDDKATWLKNLERAQAFFEAHRINQNTLIGAELPEVDDHTVQDDFASHLKRFVEFYFRS